MKIYWKKFDWIEIFTTISKREDDYAYKCENL